jgi:hypothetical protein
MFLSYFPHSSFQYCKYCYLCTALCDSICQPGGVLDTISSKIVRYVIFILTFRPFSLGSLMQCPDGFNYNPDNRLFHLVLMSIGRSRCNANNRRQPCICILRWLGKGTVIFFSNSRPWLINSMP